MPGGSPSGQPGNEPGPPGDSASKSSNGGGDRPSGAPKNPERDPLPSEPSNETPDNVRPSPAPDIQQSVPQNDVVRRLEELLKQDKVTPDLEKNMGMTKDEMQQFVKKFEKKDPRPAARAAREIQAKPGQERKIDPNRKAPDFQPGVTASNRNARGSSNLNEDNNAGLSEGSLSNAPPELRKRFEAYKSSLGRVKSAPGPSSN